MVGVRYKLVEIILPVPEVLVPVFVAPVPVYGGYRG